MKKYLSLVLTVTLIFCWTPITKTLFAYAGAWVLSPNSTLEIDYSDSVLISKNDEIIVSQITSQFLNDDVYILDSNGLKLFDHEFVCTGYKAVLYQNSKILTELTIVIVGDVDKNGQVGINDSRLALRAAVGLENLDFAAFYAADSASDGTGIEDARKILRVAAGLESFSPESGETVLNTKADILNFYKSACEKITQDGAAGYTKKEYAGIESVDCGNSLINNLLLNQIDSFTSEEDAEAQIFAKDSDAAKEAFPACNMTDTELLQSATCEDLGEYYKITLVVADEENPEKDESVLGQISNSVLYKEDLVAEIESTGQITIDEDNTDIYYDDYTITCMITKDGRFISMNHSAYILIDTIASIGQINNMQINITMTSDTDYYDFDY